MTEYIATARMMANQLRPMVLFANAEGREQVVVPIGSASAILQHLEDLAKANGERTIGAIEADLHHARAQPRELWADQVARLEDELQAARA